MDRREVLKSISVIMGGAVAPSIVQAVLSSKSPSMLHKGLASNLLDENEDALVTTISELIIFIPLLIASVWP